MPGSTRRGTPRATRMMIDVFHAIAECGDLIHYWDVAKRAEGGLLLRASSAERYATEEAAVQAAREIAARMQPAGYDVQTVSAVAKGNGSPEAGWQAFVEVVLA